MENTFEKAYTPREVKTTLDISDSALRKWCLALERNGYKFIRNDKKNRIFVENDLVILRHFQNLVKHHNMQLENAAALVIDRFGKGAFEVGTDIVPAEKEEKQPGLPRDLMRSNEGIMDTLLEHIGTQEEFNRSLVERLDKQENFNSELMQRLDQQQKQFEERLQWMEKDREFVHSVRESMKQRQLESAEHENKTSSQLMNIENQLSEIQRKQNDNETGKELAEKVEELSNQLGQVQQAMKESAAAQQEQNKKGFFARLFGKK